MRPAMPSLDELRQMTPCYETVIPQEWEDWNGHVNVQYYMRLYDDAGWVWFDQVGITLDYIKSGQGSIFDMVHHINYLAEINVGDRVSVYGLLAGRSEKRIHTVWFIVNETQNVLANACEFLTSFVDLSTRKSAPWPDDVAAKFDAMLVRDQSLSWTPPLCGAIRA